MSQQLSTAVIAADMNSLIESLQNAGKSRSAVCLLIDFNEAIKPSKQPPYNDHDTEMLLAQTGSPQ